MNQLVNWIVDQAGAGLAEITIEVPREHVVEAMMECNFTVLSINPKQLEGFWQRFDRIQLPFQP